MNWMVLPNQVCLIVKLYNNRPGLLPDSNGVEVHFDKSFLFIASLSNTVDVAKATWRNSEYYREDLDVEVTDIINIIFKIN